MALTPMMQQYFQMKDKYKECILFYRIGDFYEMFFDDAKTASKELELTLTGKNCGLEERAPMCGIPHHAAKNYIGTLISRGYKVAICEQVEDPATAKGLVKRDVIKVYTPGTYTEGSYLEENQNSYTASLVVEGSIAAIALCDVSTGEFITTECTYNPNVIVDELCKFNPREIVISKSFKEEYIAELKERTTMYISHFDDENFAADGEKLSEQFSNYDDKSLSSTIKMVCTGLIKYIEETQKLSLGHINTLEVYNINTYMTLDINSRRNLELTESLRDKGRKGSLLSVIDKTNTSMGGRRIRKWLEEPLIERCDIVERQDAVEELTRDLNLMDDLKEALTNIYDIERLVGKISSTSINARELISLKNSLSKIPHIKELLKPLDSSYLKNCYENIDELSDMHKLLEDAINNDPPLSVKEGNIIKAGYSKDVDELRDSKTHGKQWIAALENDERNVTGIKSLKVSYNKVFGYYIEVTRANLSAVPEGRYIRKQTLANAERYITPELKEMEDKILGAEEKLVSLEYDIFVGIRDELEKNVNRMKKTAKIISEIDALWSLAFVARENNYVKPSINNEGIINIKDGRHPVVESITKANTFVANDTNLDLGENRLMLITGPNMAGKSTYMRQVAIITIMAQMGSFVPAASADISICDKVFTRIGASDDLAGGKSTFMVEMWEVSNILKNATSRSLVLLDEVGRGTSTYDGLSIAWAVIEYICKNSNIKCKTLFATHYHELTRLEGVVEGVKNYSISAKKIDNNIIFLRKIVRGGADESYGIEVAKLAGLPDKLLDRAREILHDLESDPKNHVDVLEHYNMKESHEKASYTLKEDSLGNYKSQHAEASEVEENNIDENSIKAADIEKQSALEEEHTKEHHKGGHKKKAMVQEAAATQIGFTDIEKDNLISEIKNIDILKLNPMEGFNKLYEIINKAKDL